MNDFDQAARLAIKFDPAEFLRWLLSGMDPKMTFTRWLDTQTIPFPGEPDRRCDTVAELTATDGSEPPWAAVVEAQTEPESDFLDRLLEYLARLRRELRTGPYNRDRFQVVGAVVYLTGEPEADGLNMQLPGTSGIGMNWKIGCRRLAREDAAVALAAIERGEWGRWLLAWIPLMKGGNLPETIERWKQLGELEPNEQRKRLLAGLAAVFAQLTDCQLIWNKSLEGWAVKKSALMEEARQEGRDEGQVEALRDALLRVLKTRFPGAVSGTIEERIQKEDNPAHLSTWFDASLAVGSIEEFQARLS